MIDSKAEGMKMEAVVYNVIYRKGCCYVVVKEIVGTGSGGGSWSKCWLVSHFLWESEPGWIATCFGKL